MKHYGLDKDFKLNIEANHAFLAGHTFEHELATASSHGMLVRRKRVEREDEEKQRESAINQSVFSPIHFLTVLALLVR